MRKAFVVGAALVVASLLPSPALAWGFVAHRLIMARAIELLPRELQPFFTRYHDEIVMRSTDPDLWRKVGWEDNPTIFSTSACASSASTRFASCRVSTR